MFNEAGVPVKFRKRNILSEALDGFNGVITGPKVFNDGKVSFGGLQLDVPTSCKGLDVAASRCQINREIILIIFLNPSQMIIQT